MKNEAAPGILVVLGFVMIVYFGIGFAGGYHVGINAAHPTELQP